MAGVKNMIFNFKFLAKADELALLIPKAQTLVGKTGLGLRISLLGLTEEVFTKYLTFPNSYLKKAFEITKQMIWELEEENKNTFRLSHAKEIVRKIDDTFGENLVMGICRSLVSLGYLRETFDYSCVECKTSLGLFSNFQNDPSLCCSNNVCDHFGKVTKLEMELVYFRIGENVEGLK